MNAQNKLKGILRRSPKSGKPMRATAVANKKKGRGRGHPRKKNLTAYQKFQKTGMRKGMTMSDVAAAWSAKHAANPANKKRKRGKSRKKNSWGGHPAGHSTASKKGWGKRKRGVSGYKKPAFPAHRAANKKRGRGKSRKFSFKMMANPIKKLGAFIVPMRKAGAIADIKHHPIPHAVGGIGGFASSALFGGAFRAGFTGNSSEPAGDVASFVGNVVGTEIPAMIVKGIGKWTKHDQTGTRIARGWRYGGYIALGINVIATIIKYATGQKATMGQPVLKLFKEGQFMEGVRLAPKEWGLAGLGLNYDHPFKLGGKAQRELAALAEYYGLSQDEVKQLSGLGHQDMPQDYGLGAYEAALDRKIAALQMQGEVTHEADDDFYGLAQDPQHVLTLSGNDAQILGLQ